MKKKYRILIIILSALALLMLAASIGFWALFSTELSAVSTIKQIGEGLYYMEYEGDYGFDAFIAGGGAPSDQKMASYIVSFLTKGFYTPDFGEGEKSYGCSSLSSSVYTGRNFDWEYGDAIIVKAIPKDGYASVSTVYTDFLGFGEGWKPEGTGNKFMSLASVYVPLDGMNEMGLVISDLLVNNSPETHQVSDNVDTTTVSAMRLVLDKASTVEEAVELLKNVDMNSSIGSNHHYAISDRYGNSVAVEWVENIMYVTPSPVLTNHIVAPGIGEETGTEESRNRIGRLEEALKQGVATKDGVKRVMEENSYPDETTWTVVYDKSSLTLDYYWHGDYSKPISFSVL